MHLAITNMDAQDVLTELRVQEKNLRQELMEREKTFNQKKEQYLKIIGAIEALEMVEDTEDDDED
mgnify:FL=1|jgi:hypothetical protein|tara:strand:+ start:474 stop:668 length:195 start_codon:yes stop_codon:yes gene_type:complete